MKKKNKVNSKRVEYRPSKTWLEKAIKMTEIDKLMLLLEVDNIRKLTDKKIKEQGLKPSEALIESVKELKQKWTIKKNEKNK